MAELALAVLGVVPLGGLVIHSYKQAFTKLKAFKGYDNEATRIQQELDLQWQFFKNDWKILLKMVFRATGTIASTSNVASSEPGDWNDAELEAKISTTLGENHNSYRYLVETIAKSLQQLQAELNRVYLLGPSQEAGKEDVSDTVQRVRRVQDGIRIMRKSTRFSEAIDELKASTSQLMKLRSQLEKLADTQSDEKPARTNPRRIAGSKQLYANEWAECRSVCRASNALFDSLTDAWKCNSGHDKHLLKLFIGSGRTQDEVTMKMGIIYTLRKTFQPSLAQLEVRSESLQWRESPPRDGIDRPPKRPKIPTRSQEASEITLVSGINEPNPGFLRSKDLRSSEDICLSLTCTPAASQPWARSSIYLGHLDGQCRREGYRHTFYSDHGRAIFRPNREPTPVDEMLGEALRDRVSRMDKLRLARYVTLTVLKFHSTPWLGDVWQLRDLSMFVDDMEDLSQRLETLHLNIDLARPRLERSNVMQTTPAHAFPARTEDEILYNIKNRPLYSLGVALLQIDRWSRLDMWNVVAVRNAADTPSQISEKFRYLTERCLECNFGPGCSKTLADAKLQRAVFKYVISELDVLVSLAEKMDLFESTDDERDVDLIN